MSSHTLEVVSSPVQDEEMREEVMVSVELSYSCPAVLSLTDQKACITSDIGRLMDADSTTSVEFVSCKVQDIQPEAQIYSNWKQTNNVPKIQADRMIETLASHYDMDADQVTALLEYALCDLRHLADERDLDFGCAHENSYKSYLMDRAS